MPQTIQNGTITSYRCAECGFHYETEDLAAQCEAWCAAHKSCNIEITKRAIENKTLPTA